MSSRLLVRRRIRLPVAFELCRGIALRLVRHALADWIYSYTYRSRLTAANVVSVTPHSALSLLSAQSIVHRSGSQPFAIRRFVRELSVSDGGRRRMRCQWLPGQYRRSRRGQRENVCCSTRTIGGRRCRTSALATGSSGSLQRMQRENGRTAEARSKRRRRCRTAGPEGRKGRCPRRVDRVDMVRRTRDDREVRGNRTDADEALRRQSAQWPVGSHATGAPPPHHKTVNIYLIIN